VRGSFAVDSKVTYYGGSAPTDAKLHQQINWLNANVPLALPLEYEKVAGDLVKLDSKDAMRILKQLEESAEEVRDPNGYVIAKARRSGGGGRKKGRRARGGGAGGGGGGGDDGEMVDEFED